MLASCLIHNCTGRGRGGPPKYIEIKTLFVLPPSLTSQVYEVKLPSPPLPLTPSLMHTYGLLSCNFMYDCLFHVASSALNLLFSHVQVECRIVNEKFQHDA